MAGGLLDLAGRGALVVGAGKGIGRATARMLGDAGAHTIVLDRHLDRADAVVSEIREAGGRADAVCADVTSLAGVADAVARADRLSERLDILVNITGSSTWIPLLEFDDASWDRDFAVNLGQHLHVSRAAAKMWIERGQPGVICVVASISGLWSSTGHAAYGAAKAGLLSFVRTAAEEWWSSGIRVNAVVPGSVHTPRIEETWVREAGVPRSEEMLARVALPADVAGPIAYLVSDLSSKVTGQAIVIDGGSSTRYPYAQA